MSKPYSSLLSAIARALPCLPENINESKIMWKPKKPQNAAKLPLGKTDGYKAILTEMGDKGGSRTVLLYMPPPTKPMEDATRLSLTLPSSSLLLQVIQFSPKRHASTRLFGMKSTVPFPNLFFITRDDRGSALPHCRSIVRILVIYLVFPLSVFVSHGPQVPLSLPSVAFDLGKIPGTKAHV
ncbi:hypothetical protein B0H13DRAFT_2301214 [Mycena leptocephala]|nr:hypothetical protein B0H13DRAFT_2301214 [Mycena leptocephala]